MFDGRPNQYIETEVKFEDGRSGSIAADIHIEDVAQVPLLARAA